MKTEIEIKATESDYPPIYVIKEGEWLTIKDEDEIILTMSETIKLRDFLNQLDLGEDWK